MFEHQTGQDTARFDIASLGEVMLRLDPGEGRIRTSRTFRAWEGGGEYNVARGLSRVFGLRACIVTALADNEVGRLVEDLILAWRTGHLVHPLGRLRRSRTGSPKWPELHRTGIRCPRCLRGELTAGTAPCPSWSRAMSTGTTCSGTLGVRWFHTGGIFAGLSEQAAETASVAVQAAKRHGVVVSYDLNYRPSLWRSIGGQPRAQQVNRAIAPYVDVMLGNEEDFTAALGFAVDGMDTGMSRLEVDQFASMINDVVAEFPNLTVVASTLRVVHSATVNDWGAVGWSAETGFVHAEHRARLEIFDRVGGGDSFASGLIYGLLNGEPLQTAVDYGAAHGALGDDDPRRHLDDEQGRGLQTRSRRWRSGGALEQIGGRSGHGGRTAPTSTSWASISSAKSWSGTPRRYRSTLTRTCSALRIPKATLDTAGCLSGNAMAASGSSTPWCSQMAPSALARSRTSRGTAAYSYLASGAGRAVLSNPVLKIPPQRSLRGLSGLGPAPSSSRPAPARCTCRQAWRRRAGRRGSFASDGRVGPDADGSHHPLRPKFGQRLEALTRRTSAELVGSWA